MPADMRHMRNTAFRVGARRLDCLSPGFLDPALLLVNGALFEPVNQCAQTFPYVRTPRHIRCRGNMPRRKRKDFRWLKADGASAPRHMSFEPLGQVYYLVSATGNGVQASGRAGKYGSHGIARKSGRKGRGCADDGLRQAVRVKPFLIADPPSLDANAVRLIRLRLWSKWHDCPKRPTVARNPHRPVQLRNHVPQAGGQGQLRPKGAARPRQP